MHNMKIYFTLLCTLLALNAAAGSLTETDVKGLIAKADKAAVTLNASDLASTLSDDVIIIMNINMQGQKHVMKPSKTEYISMVQQGWTTYSNYTYSKSDVVIKMQDDKAFVTSKVSESMTVQGSTMSGESKEEVTIELVNGRPLITRMVGYTSM